MDDSPPITSDAAVRAASPGDHSVPGVRGVLLRVRATKKGVLTRRWIWRAPNKKRSPRAIGHYPIIGLAEARQKAVDFERAFAKGNDLGIRATRRRQDSEAARSLTLGNAIDGYFADAARPFKNAKNDRIRERALRTHFAPLHARDVAAITVSDVAAILRKLASETAVKSHSAIRAVFDYAATTLEPHKVVITNPADPRRLRSVGWRPKSRSENKLHAAVDWRIAPSVVSELSHMDEAVAACVILMIATGMRAKTARLAKWANIVLDPKGENSTWTPPPADLKERHHKRPFIIPLNSIALDALKRDRTSRFVFGSLSESILNSFLHRLRRRHPDWVDSEDNERPFTFHGFRATFRTWVKDKRPEDDALAELSLGHKVHGDVAGRYIRTGLVEERRALLDAWSCHLRSESAKIITLRTG